MRSWTRAHVRRPPAIAPMEMVIEAPEPEQARSRARPRRFRVAQEPVEQPRTVSVRGPVGALLSRARRGRRRGRQARRRFIMHTVNDVRADVRFIGAARDKESAVEHMLDNGNVGGAFTSSFLSVVYSLPDLECDLRDVMRKTASTGAMQRASQKCTLSRSIPNGAFDPIPPGGRAFKALFIGIDYTGSEHELNGCFYDASQMLRLASDKMGFAHAGVAFLSDAPGYVQPTKVNIMRALRWLVKDAQSGDALFLYYSGHGTSLRDVSGDEKDMRDEAIVPVDFATNGFVLDDEILVVVARLREGVRLTAIFDSCHSGTMFA